MTRTRPGECYVENLLGQCWSVEILEFLARELAHETRRMGQLRGRREGGKKVEKPSNRSGSPCKWFVAWLKILTQQIVLFESEVRKDQGQGHCAG